LNHVLLLCRSVTQGQRVARLLGTAGISNRLLRSPAGLTERGCSYSVKIYERELPSATLLLTKNGIYPLGVVREVSGGGYEEVRWP